MTPGRIQVGGTTARFAPGETVFAQGERCPTVLYIESGRIRLLVASPGGTVAVIGTVADGMFIGEGALAGQRRRKSTAVAVTPTTVTVLKTGDLRRRLRDETGFADWFRRHLLARNVAIEKALAGRLFNGAEKRLASTLLLLTRFDEHRAPSYELPLVSRALLAEVSGLTRSKLDLLMAGFRKRGFIGRGLGGSAGMQVHRSLLTVLLQD